MNIPESLIAPRTIQSIKNDLSRNVLNFEEPFSFHELDDPVAIYRVMPVESLFEILHRRRLTLRPPSRWDDPFENYVLNHCHQQGKLFFPAHIFGQCWTLHAETDAMWRIYSPTKNGVKVKVVAQELFEQMFLSEEVDRNQHLSCFIGKVRYVETEEFRDIEGHVRAIVSGKGSSHNVPIAQTLLMKRSAFEHEAEVRLIYLDQHDLPQEERRAGVLQDGSGNLSFEFEIYPESLIREIVFDPRMDNHLFGAYASHARSLGYTGPVSKSSLYSME